MTQREHLAERTALVLSVLLTAYLWGRVAAHTIEQIEAEAVKSTDTTDTTNTVEDASDESS